MLAESSRVFIDGVVVELTDGVIWVLLLPDTLHCAVERAEQATPDACCWLATESYHMVEPRTRTEVAA